MLPGNIPNGLAINKNILDYAGAAADSYQRVGRGIGLAAAITLPICLLCRGRSVFFEIKPVEGQLHYSRISAGRGYMDFEVRFV